MNYRDHRAKLWGCIAVMGFFALLALLPFFLVNPSPYMSTMPRVFESASWKAGAASAWDDDRRCGMVADLRFRVGLVGRTRVEVVSMLGPPENERVEPDLSHWHLCPSFMDIWILEIRWRDGRVADARVRDT